MKTFNAAVLSTVLTLTLLPIAHAQSGTIGSAPADAPAGVSPIAPVTAAVVTTGTFAPPPALPAAPTPAAPTVVPAGSVASDYKLDVDDTVSVSVMRHGDVGGSFHIPPDGLIRLQRLTTPIDARGKTVAELTDAILEKLTTEGKLRLHAGQVSVSVVGLRMRPIFVRGNAVGGREYDLKNGWRVDDVVAIMGGISQPDRLTAQITNPLRPAPVPVNLAVALANPASPENAALQEGDTLIVTAPMQKRLTIKGEGPRGMHDVDERYGLRAALNQMGFSTNGSTGDLRHARIVRNATAGDYGTTSTYIPVDIYTLLTNDTTPDIPFKDLDTLDIPVSQDYIYVTGEIGGPRKQYLPQDRKTYLVDVYSNAGDVTGNAKMGSIKLFHQADDGNWTSKTYDLGKFFKTADNANNPEIHPHDMVYVPSNNRVDPVGSIWTGWGLFNIIKALAPGL